MVSGKTSPRASLYILANAWYATKPRTRDEAERCSAQFARARDFLLFEPARPLVINGVSISQAEYAEGRAEALEELRSRCRLCGLCTELGIDTP